MNELPQIGTREYALADALSRPNAMNGLYKKLGFPLEYQHLKKKDPIYITDMINHADTIIKGALDNQKNLDDLKVQEGMQAAFYGGAAGASAGLAYYKLLRFLGLHR